MSILVSSSSKNTHTLPISWKQGHYPSLTLSLSLSITNIFSGLNHQSFWIFCLLKFDTSWADLLLS